MMEARERINWLRRRDREVSSKYNITDLTLFGVLADEIENLLAQILSDDVPSGFYSQGEVDNEVEKAKDDAAEAAVLELLMNYH